MDGSLAEGADWCLPAHGTACFDMLPATVVHAMTGASVDRPLDLGPARRTLRARGDRLLRCLRLAVVRAPRRASAPRTRSRPRPRIEADEPVPVDHRRTHDDDPHRAAGRRRTASTNGSCSCRRRTGSSPHSSSRSRETPLPNTLLAHGVSAGDVFPDGDFYPTLRHAGVDRSRRAPVRDRREHARRDAAPPRRRPPVLRHRRRRRRPRRAPSPRPTAATDSSTCRTSTRRCTSSAPTLLRSTADRRNAHRPRSEPARGSLPEGTLVLITADHGMAAVDPERSLYVNELWPEIVDHLESGADGRPLAPAGSSRDLFLHTRSEAATTRCGRPCRRFSKGGRRCTTSPN